MVLGDGCNWALVWVLGGSLGFEVWRGLERALVGYG